MKFRNQIAFFLACAVLISAQGFAYTAHFCGDKLASLEFFNLHPKGCVSEHEKSTPCCNERQEKSNKCCIDKTVVAKEKSGFHAQVFPEFNFLAVIFSDVSQHSVFTSEDVSPITSFCYAHPPGNAPPKYILFCSLKYHLG